MPQLCKLSLNILLALFLSCALLQAVEDGKRPRVFIALTGTNALADANNDNQWQYVRSNIDGVFYNAAGQDESTSLAILKKIQTKKAIGIFNLNNDSALPTLGAQGAGNPVAHIQVTYPELQLNIESYAIYYGDIARWEPGTVAQARQNYVDNDSPWRAPRLMGGFPSDAFNEQLPRAYDPQRCEIFTVPNALNAYRTSDQAFVESRVFHNLIPAIKLARTNHTSFMWFIGSQFPVFREAGAPYNYDFNTTYNLIKEYLTEDDIIMIMNYDAQKKCVPETDKDSYTYILKWLLEKGTNKYQGKQAPTDISFHPRSPPSSLPLNTTIGTFSTTDPDIGDSDFSYSLTAGGIDNDQFVIENNQLKIGPRFKRANRQSTYKLLVRTYDQWAFWHEKNIQFSITPATGFNVAINFQPASAPTVTGWSVDSGALYGARASGFTYGWDANVALQTRDRNDSRSATQLHDTLVRMQKPEAPNATWEINVPNGNYEVRLVVGDPSFLGSTHRLMAEGIEVVNFTPTDAVRWAEQTGSVTVSDGRLTITHGTGSINAKMCAIEIRQLVGAAN